jgi:hypothetical protein
MPMEFTDFWGAGEEGRFAATCRQPIGVLRQIIDIVSHLFLIAELPF